MKTRKKWLDNLRFPILPILVLLAFPLVSFLLNPLIFQLAVAQHLKNEGVASEIATKDFQMIDFKLNEKSLRIKFRDNPYTYYYTYDYLPTRLRVAIIDEEAMPINSYLFGGKGDFEEYTPNEAALNAYTIYEKDDFIEGRDNTRLK